MLIHHEQIGPNTLKYLTKLTGLQSLRMSGLIPPGFFTNLFQTLTQLEALHVSTWKDINVYDEDLLYLSNLGCLRSLTLYSLDQATSGGMRRALSRLTNLKYLNVAGKRLVPSEMDFIIEMPLRVVKINGAIAKNA